MVKCSSAAVSLSTTRAEIAQRLKPPVFISIHHNGGGDHLTDRPGTETYFQIGVPESRRLAGLVYEEVVRAMSQYKVAWVADRDAGAKYRPGSNGDYYAMLRQPGKVVSVLAELAFISNPAEAELLPAGRRVRVRGRLKAEQFRASRVWPRLVHDLHADLEAFGSARL